MVRRVHMKRGEPCRLKNHRPIYLQTKSTTRRTLLAILNVQLCHIHFADYLIISGRLVSGTKSRYQIIDYMIFPLNSGVYVNRFG